LEPLEPPLPHLPGVRHREVEAGADGPRLHVAELGAEDAPPLLLVHGWPQHWWCWHKVAPGLSQRFRCLMVDLRGHGWSAAPAGGYDKERLAQDLLGVLDGLGLDRVGYVGHDWGAYCGYLLALRAPERLTGLLPLSVPHLWPSGRDRLNPWRAAAFAYQLPLATGPVARALLRRGVVGRLLSRQPAGAFSAADVQLYDAIMRTDRGARVTIAMYRTFLLRELPAVARGRYADARLSVPTRAVVGDRDPLVRGADLRGHESHATDMTLERVLDAGHFLPEERPELVAARIGELFG
jgi:pimeloyl-ACP methyl ester carboxylesterase